MDQLFYEDLNSEFGYYYRQKKILFEKKSKFQTIQLADTNTFGKCLLLDDITQVGEKTEAYYHEPMAHFPMTLHEQPKEVLVIGAGDGGILREVLKHSVVKNLTHVDIDADVVQFCKEHLGTISQGCWDHKKTKLIIDDGRRFVERNPKKFDVIIMDMTDPFGPSTALYTKEFFQAVKKSFKKKKQGYFCMHSESPIMRPEAYKSILKTLKEVFSYVLPHFLYIQMYGTLWSIAVCSDSPTGKKITARQFDKRLRERKIKKLKIVTGASFKAMQVAYPEIAKLTKGKAKRITDRDASFPDEDERACYYDPHIKK